MSEFSECLEKGKIKSYPKISEKLEMERGAAKDDLAAAKRMLKRGEFKYATITGYYSLFHSARALLYSRGFRERSHYCLRVAIAHLFVRENLLEEKFLEYFDEALGLREAADYQSLFSKDGAERAVGGASKFLRATKEILGK
ncbi:HEPN domain-containing protein [Candidatus Gottesmanbacteria bacterium]|nr:HEPN domain-containing protein [Candidatus Gottesmanbacteria bacterium]